MYKIRKIIFIFLGLCFFLTSCDDDNDKKPTPPPSFRKIEPFPKNYFEVPPPPPAPEPPPIERLIDMGAPALPPPKEIEAPPPPPRDAEQEYLERVKLTSEERLIGRMISGPSFIMSANAEYNYVQQPQEQKWQLSDPDYSREDPPTVTSSYPVDRSFILTTDRTISGVLLHRINSQIASEVRVMVDRDIFGADKRYKLLEKGDIFIGRYESLAKVGDTRLNISFYKIIRSDGALIYKSDEPIAYATDKMGSTGLIGEIDNRNWERYGSAAISAAIGAAAGAAESMEGNDAFANFSEKLGEDVSTITAKILEQSINLAPIVTIGAGEVLNMELLKEIYLRRPKKL
ncbi:MAG: TrbI/VirB10 family protein [Bacilli bacterium]